MLRYGFFNSNNGDRTYDANDMSRLFEGIITDGVFAGVRDEFKIEPIADQLSVKVRPGRAWFNGIWIDSDSDITFAITQNAGTNPRDDYILLIVDKRSSKRECKIIYQENTDHYSGGDDVYVYILAHITISPRQTVLDDVDIEEFIGTGSWPGHDGIPWVGCPIDHIDIDYTEILEYVEAEVDAAINVAISQAGLVRKPADIGGGYAVSPETGSGISKTANIPDFVLTHGGLVCIKFTSAVRSSSNLNISNTGAKSINYKGSPIGDSVIKAGSIATMVYNANSDVYQVVAIDDLDIDVGEGSVIVGYVTNLDTGGTLSPGMIYSAMVNRQNYFYCLHDTYTHQTLWLGKAPLTSGGTADFYTVDSANNQIVVATLGSTGGVTYSTVPIGGGGSQTWNDIKPAGGVPKTDLAALVQASLDRADMAITAFPITFGIDNSRPVCDTLYTDIYNAINAGSMVIPYYDGMVGILLDIVGQNSDYIFAFIDSKITPTTVYFFTIDYQDTVTLKYQPIGTASVPEVVFNSSAAPETVQALDNHIYNFTNAAVTSLTISSAPSGTAESCVIIFNSGSTPTSLTLPSNVKTPSGFTVEANKHYEISITGTKYAVVASWPLT